VLGLSDAQHEETAPHATALVISRLACSLAGQQQRVQLVPGTRAQQAYGSETAVEAFRCSYGLNPAYRDRLAQGPLVVSGVGAEGEARIVELPGHRFFLATLYVPQLSSSPGAPHPLIRAYLEASIAFRLARGRGAAETQRIEQ
jgi:CTP synthase (UTP-ammonia lyase)